MKTTRELRTERLKAILRHPRRGLPEVRQHVRRRIGMALEWASPLLRRLNGSGWSPPPALVNYAINAPCNLSCYSCDAGTGDKTFLTEHLARSARPRLSLDEFRAVVRSTKPYNPDFYICLMEPLLTPDTPAHVRVVVEEGMRCMMNTNGVLLEGKAREVVESGLHHLFVSLDGPTPEINDPIRGEKAFERTIAGIRAVAREKEALGSHWPEIVLCATMSDRNTAHLVAMAEFALTLPVQALAYQHLWWVSEEMASAHNRDFPDYPVTAARTQTRPMDVDLKLLSGQIREIRERFKGYPVSFSLDMTERELETYYRTHLEAIRPEARCPVMWKRLEMLPNGDVMVNSACPSHLLGNVRKEPLFSIWNGGPARAFRKRMMATLAPRCTHCYDVYKND